MCARRREAQVRAVPGFMAGAQAVTAPVERTAALRKLNAMAAVRCSAWLGVSFVVIGVLRKGRNENGRHRVEERSTGDNRQMHALESGEQQRDAEQ